MQLTYIIGQPGSGKSTLVRALTCRTTASPGKVDAVPVVVYTSDGTPIAIELGRRRDTFSGTDALSMGILPKALDALAVMAAAHNGWHAVFAEGDRLATVKFFVGARDRGWNVTVVHLDTPDSLCAARRLARGSTQADGWVRGRITKTANLVAACEKVGVPVITVAVAETATPSDVAAQVATVPVLSRFAALHAP